METLVAAVLLLWRGNADFYQRYAGARKSLLGNKAQNRDLAITTSYFSTSGRCTKQGAVRAIVAHDLTSSKWMTSNTFLVQTRTNRPGATKGSRQCWSTEEGPGFAKRDAIMFPWSTWCSQWRRIPVVFLEALNICADDCSGAYTELSSIETSYQLSSGWEESPVVMEEARRFLRYFDNNLIWKTTTSIPILS